MNPYQPPTEAQRAAARAARTFGEDDPLGITADRIVRDHLGLPRVHRYKQRTTKRMLALIAWAATHIPPGITPEEHSQLVRKLTTYLSRADAEKVVAFIQNEASLLRALR